MSDRETFLEAIRENPADDVVRIVYADWLDEYGETDADHACAEFITLSCDRSGKTTMPQDAYAWLWQIRHVERGDRTSAIVKLANWKRLVPSLVARHSPAPWGSGAYDYDGPDFATRDGRIIHCPMRVPLEAETVLGTRNYYRVVPVTLWFCRGFVERARIDHKPSRAKLWPALAADQPFVRWYDRKTRACVESELLLGACA